VTASPLEWTIQGGCRDGFYFVNQAQIEVTGDEAHLCGAFLIGDKYNEYQLLFDGDQLTVRSRFTPEYVNATDKYPCRVRVVTNRCVRTITYDPPGLITDERKEYLEKLKRNFEGVCRKLQDSITQRIDWRPRPPGPIETPEWQLWQIAVKGLAPGDPLVITDAGGRELVNARASQAGVAQLSTLLSAEMATRSIDVALRGTDAHRKATISGQQIRFARMGSIPIKGKLRELRFEQTTEGQQLCVRDDRAEMRWDMSNPRQPALLQSIPRRAENGPVFSLGSEVSSRVPARLEGALRTLQDRFSDAAAVGFSRVPGIGDALYVRTGERARLFDIKDSGEPQEMQSHAAPIWFEGAALAGRLMARHEPKTGSVDIYRAIERATI
jgi:hypothetical protein